MPLPSMPTTADFHFPQPPNDPHDPHGDKAMNEMSKTQLLERVTHSNRPNGNPRVQKIAARIIGDLFRAIDDLDIQPDEFWAGVDWLSRLASSGQAGLITAGLGFDRLIDI